MTAQTVLQYTVKIRTSYILQWLPSFKNVRFHLYKGLLIVSVSQGVAAVKPLLGHHPLTPQSLELLDDILSFLVTL